jgi:hypothetical protein
VGSPYQTTFAERDQPHGFLLLDVDEVKWQFIEYLQSPKYKVVTIKKLTDIENIDTSGNFIKIKLSSDKINKNKLRDLLFESGAISVDIIPPEDVKEIEKYYDKDFNNNPADVAHAYIESLSNLPFEKEKLLKYFNKIEEYANKMTEFELNEI